MLSKAIITKLKATTALATLCGGAEKMFAEIGQNTPTLIVKLNDVSQVTTEIEVFKLARIQLLIQGYSVAAGEAIAEAALAAIKLLEGDTATDGVYTYAIKAVVHLNGPVLITWNDANTLSVNLVVYFTR